MKAPPQRAGQHPALVESIFTVASLPAFAPCPFAWFCVTIFRVIIMSNATKMLPIHRQISMLMNSDACVFAWQHGCWNSQPRLHSTK